MLLLLFACDHYNQSHYLTLYFVNMLNLNTSYIDIYKEFLSGNFAVQQSLMNSFRKLEPKKVIKSRINKDTKSLGGTADTSKQGLSYLNANSI